MCKYAVGGPQEALLHETRPACVAFRLGAATQRISYENTALDSGGMGLTQTYQRADRQDLCIGGRHLGRAAWSCCFSACDAFIRSHCPGNTLRVLPQLPSSPDVNRQKGHSSSVCPSFSGGSSANPGAGNKGTLPPTYSSLGHSHHDWFTFCATTSFDTRTASCLPCCPPTVSGRMREAARYRQRAP